MKTLKSWKIQLNIIKHVTLKLMNLFRTKFKMNRWKIYCTIVIESICNYFKKIKNNSNIIIFYLQYLK